MTKGRLLVTLLALMVTVMAVLWAFRFGMGYVQQYRIHAAIDRWQHSTKPMTVDQWNELEQEAKSALLWSPNEADLHNALGRIYALRTGDTGASKLLRRAYANKAIAEYSRVVALRPAWPYGWMNRAAVLADVDLFNAQFKQNLFMSIRLGPWERTTLPVNFRLAFQAWPYLNRDERKQLLPYLIKAATERKKDIWPTIQSKENRDFFCQAIIRNSASLPFCPNS